jgi:Cytochrome P450
MANPTRLPRTVPSVGWDFKGTHFPGSITVGCSAFELHLNPIAFPYPESFSPERWLVDDAKAKEAMSKSWFAFGAGSRACIARNLAMTELYMATERLVESGVLDGARACQEEVQIYEWFNSSVKAEKIELVWPTWKPDRRDKRSTIETHVAEN